MGTELLVHCKASYLQDRKASALPIFLHISAVLIVGSLLSCANHPCHEPKEPEGLKASTFVEPPQESQNGRVWIVKGDNSKQCGTQGTSLDAMAKQLKGIQVFSKEKKSDGLMHIQMCGADTGRLNAYEIKSSDLKTAKDVGFREWK